MRQSLRIELEQLFGTACTADLLDMKPSIRMKSSDITCWKNHRGEAILQEFNGMACFIYCLDIYMVGPADISLYTTKRSLHAFYSMTGSCMTHIIDGSNQHHYPLSPERARYLYLPTGRYALQIPEAQSSIFGFYVKGKLFRQGNERPFHFLHPLIEAYRNNSEQSCASLEIRIGPRTKRRISQFLSNLQRGQLINEGHILNQLYALFKLTSDKLFEAYHKLSEAAIKAREAYDLIVQYIDEYGQSFSLSDICHSIQISLDYLHELFQKYHQMTPTELKNKLLETKIKELLMEDMQVSHIAYSCGYSSASALNKFFKKRTGMTPTAYCLQNQ